MTCICGNRLDPTVWHTTEDGTEVCEACCGCAPDLTWGEGYYRLVDGPPTTVRIVVENSDRAITADEMGEFYRLARAAEEYLKAIRPNTLTEEPTP